MRIEAFRPDDERVEHGGGRSAGLLGDREGCRQDRNRRMTDVGEMRVVVVERVRGGAVGERRGASRNLLVQSCDRSRLFAAFVGDEAADGLCNGLVLARPRHREPVVERKARHRAGGGGDRFGRNGRDVQEAIQSAGREHGLSSDCPG
jgi:hypothetical protein